MALEQVFDCPLTLRRLRTGPLGKLLEGFCHWLLDVGFTRGCIRTHLSNVSHLNQYLARGMARPRATVTAKDIEGFFKAKKIRCQILNRYEVARPLSNNLKGGCLISYPFG